MLNKLKCKMKIKYVRNYFGGNKHNTGHRKHLTGPRK